MPSVSLQNWLNARAASLDEIENAHRSVGGTGPGRRTTTQQINQAYAMLLSAQFQGFCRDLHSECVELLVIALVSVEWQTAVEADFNGFRKLDRGNPTPGNIGADFDRLGFSFWDAVAADDARNHQRQAYLEELNRWRNAIAHQDFDLRTLGGSSVLRLNQVRAWRSACDALARSFDNVMRAYLQIRLGRFPW